MFDVVVRHVTCRHAAADCCCDLSRHHPDQAPEEKESSSQAQADHPRHLGTTSIRLYHICVIMSLMTYVIMSLMTLLSAKHIYKS